jgi:hypothetical protein
MSAGIRRALLSAAAAVTVAVGAFCGTAQAVSVTFTGPEEYVWQWQTVHCSAGDIPDGPAQAFRDATGRIQIISGHPTNARMIGPDFNNLTRDCTPTFASVGDPAPAHYNYMQWINGTYTENGQDVYALLHNEWHGWEIPGACPAGPGKRRCGVGAVTFAVSHDGGNSYVQPAPPDNFVATVPPRPTVDDLRTGLFAPSGPVKKGSYYYSIVLLGAANPAQDVGACMMRTKDIADPSGWRGWDGASFSVRFQNPYYENVSPQRTHSCEPVDYDNVQSMSRSLTYNTALGKYILTGNAIKFDPVQSRNVYGFYFSTSDDLVHWSMRQLLFESPSLTSHECGGPDATAYPSLIDHSALDRNFRVTDASVYLYFTRLHYSAACTLTSDRDLMRVPIQFSP